MSNMNDGERPSKRFCRAKPEDLPTLLQEKASQFGCKLTDEEFALKMDLQDPLACLQKEFEIPKMKDLPGVDVSLVDMETDCIYMCGNSLGLMPRSTRQYITNELDKWSKVGVYGHFMGELPWAKCDERVQEDMSKLVGAETSEVSVMNALTVNLHLLMVTFYQPTDTRNKILVESKAFPSDQYMIESQIQLHGYNPNDCIIYANPRQGEYTLRTEDILELIDKYGSEIATIMFSGVQYYTGQLFDMEAITKAGHEKGCMVGFDLAHAVGNVELQLHDWNVDFAAWCNYKYVNAGAGCIAGAFIHDRHSINQKPKLLGWWGHRWESRFKMENTMDLSPGVAGYRISNPSIMSVAPLKASLEVFNQTSMAEIVAKQVLLTGYLEYLVNHNFAKDVVKPGMPYINIITPTNPKERGCQLSLIFSNPIKQLHIELKKRGVTLYVSMAEKSIDISMPDDIDQDDDVDHEDDDDDVDQEDVNQDDDDQEEDLFKKEMLSVALKKQKSSKSKPGIIYFSRIPMFMRPNRLKMIFSDYGQVGRVYLQAEEKFKKDQRKKKTGSRGKVFTEGWIEFMDKKVAKKIALRFNNTPIGGKKTSRHYDDLWNIKYLSRFQWSHLVERLEYEKAVRDQRMRTEISQVKKETNFFIKNIEKKKVLDKLEDKKRKKGKEWTSKMRNFKQRKTDEQHELTKKVKDSRKTGVSSDFLQKIFQG